MVALGLGWAFSVFTPAARAVSPSPDAMVESRRWVAAAFEGTVAPAPTPGMEVLSNYDLIQKNARFGKPLKLAGTKYTRGLFCHANSKIVVRLPSPGKNLRGDRGCGQQRADRGRPGERRVCRAGGWEGRLSFGRPEGGPARRAGQGGSGRRHGVHPGGQRFGRRIRLRSGRLGRRQDHSGRRAEHLARRPGGGGRTRGGRSPRAPSSPLSTTASLPRNS